MTTTGVQLPSSEEMRERLAAWCERYRVPGASIAWTHGDETHSAAAGVINLGTGVEATPDTLFQIGSITKVYTTTLIMQLVDEGRLALDAPACTYLPRLRFADETATRTVTIRQLLTHTSGVDGDFFEDFGRGDDCVEKYVAACATLPQVFAPGAMFSYCNAGFVVLGRIIETMTGLGWDDALKTRLLRPLGVSHTVTLPEQALLHRTAAGHIFDAQLALRPAPVWGMARSAGPAGATPCSTVDDLLAFARMHVAGGVASDGTRLVSEASVRAMQQVQHDLPSQPGEGPSHWGLGWMLFDWGGRRVIGHDGGTIGQISSLRVLPEERFAVAVLTNAVTSGAILASRIMRWLFAETLGIAMPEHPRPPEEPVRIDLRPYAGVYGRLGFRIEVEEHDGALTLTTTNTGPLAALAPPLPPSELIAVEPGLFLERNPYMRVYTPLRFSDIEDGRARYLRQTRVARRVE
ncbi:MAG: beta-lactamase family protein [Dehalococcoidia bacterium]|nr:beta-lactamase family protein [Dehalococcoidia bacterium]